ncbi:DNA ligase (NAD+) [Clostridiales Family XIII bacterium PM5-7]
MEDKKSLIKEKVELLNQARKAYEQEDMEIMSNFAYDKLYDELIALEAETGIVLAGSPTQNVGYEVLSSLPKEQHPSKMLSLDKTKERDSLSSWLGGQQGILSWKLDGLTIVLTYQEGKLVKALTRGNGEVGEVVTSNAKTFVNLPVEIPYKGRLVLRGEAIIKYSDFEKINQSIPDEEARYKNPRNLCSGSVRQLNSQITAERNVNFYAFNLVEADGIDFGSWRENQLVWLKQQGFDVVEYQLVRQDDVVEAIGEFEAKLQGNDLPSDGLVLTFNDMQYSNSLGATSKFPRDSIAFKWRDQIAETTLQEIEWSASRTGLINPVAIFDPVELEGTTVSRASVHNVSVMRELKLGIGDKITVYKANMIIPQIAENLTESNNVHVPEHCPVCGEHTEIKNDNGVETLMCVNADCLAKQIKQFTLFVSRDAMNIDGLSEATIEKLIAKGLITELADVFNMEQFGEVITQMEGFGEKSFTNLVRSVEAAKDTTPARLLYALGIPGIGVANAKVIARACHQNWERMTSLTTEELVEIDGIGEIMASAYASYFGDTEKRRMVEDILERIRLDETEEVRGNALEGMTFVITGSLNQYENRDALKTEIEAAGGKVAGSVSAKTSYLINNDRESTSGKNKKAKELGISIIDEDMVKKLLGY